VHNRKKNAQYQTAFRTRHRTQEETERIQRRTWQLDGAKYRAESLVADGMTASAAAEHLGVSHHTIIAHLSRPDARRRIGILMRDTGEPEQPC
jgi:DNA-binding CsgD family transcriptional regulator